MLLVPRRASGAITGNRVGARCLDVRSAGLRVLLQHSIHLPRARRSLLEDRLSHPLVGHRLLIVRTLRLPSFRRPLHLILHLGCGCDGLVNRRDFSILDVLGDAWRD